MLKGIDVSSFQGDIDFKKVKSSGVDFVIVYGGMGRLASQKSVYFEKNYANAKAAGLKVGAYWYSYAKSAAEAELEAKACIEAIGGKTYDLPIFLDMEEPSQLALGKSVCSGITKAFCNYLIKKGIRAGLYISYSPLMDCISEDVRKAYPMWIAQYYSVCQYSNAAIWQYTDKGTVPGIGVYVDMNYLYDEKLISGSKPAQSKLAQSKSKPDEISQETSSSKVDFKVKITSSNGVNIRSGASTSYKILGAVPYGCEVRISRQTSGGGYSWGLTTYNGIKGWIALDFTKRVGTSGIKVGSTVRVKSGALVYGTNTPLSSWVYSRSFTVMELNGDRAVIGIDGNVTAAVDKDELIVE